MSNTAIIFNHEKVSGQGEDADPLHIGLGRDCGFIATFDGMGGAGAERFDNNVTGAKLAAALARETVNKVWAEVHETLQRRKKAPPHGLDAPPALLDEQTHAINQDALAADVDPPDDQQHSEILKNVTGSHIASKLDSAFTKRALELPDTSRLKSKSIRKLPTTFAGSYYRTNGNQIEGRTYWAGDSRVYFMSPHSLDLLTIDHSRIAASSNDPYASFDSPLTNFISENTPNTVQTYDFRFTAPGFLFSCTDGVYAYLPHLVYLEHYILRHCFLGEKLLEPIARFCRDDASIALVQLGMSETRQLPSSVNSGTNILAAAWCRRRLGLATAVEGFEYVARERALTRGKLECLDITEVQLRKTVTNQYGHAVHPDQKP